MAESFMASPIPLTPSPSPLKRTAASPIGATLGQ
jgi:hypothetical protein